MRRGIDEFTLRVCALRESLTESEEGDEKSRRLHIEG